MDLAGVTEETLNQMREPMSKALTTGYTVATGLQGYELAAPAKFLVPVRSPWRNRLSRKMAPVGSTVSHWKAITGINVGNASPFVGFGAAGAVVQTQETDYAATYEPIALGDTVQMDAQALARGFDDLRARSGINLLFALMIAEDRLLLGGQNFALQTPGTPSVTTATTGGSIAQTTAVHFVVAVRTIEGYFYALSNAAGTAAGTAAGGGTVTSADGTATTPTDGLSTHTAQATVAAVAGAVAYDWYVGASNTAYYFAGTTTAPVSPVVTALPNADATNPTTSLPQLVTARAGGGLNIRTGGAAFVDTSADSNAFPGLLATMAGDISSSTGVQVQRGTGTSSGAFFTDLAGAKITGSQGTVSEIDTLLLSLYNSSGISPTRMLMSAQQHLDVSAAMVKSGAFTTFLQGEDMAFRQAATGGQFQTKYINKAANGFPIEMETMPNLPPGVILMVTEVLPFPNNEVNAVFDVECQQEYTQLEYAMSRGTGTTGGPRYDLEVRSIETFRNFFPSGCAALTGIGNGIN
jgi:hypothetical protein